MPCDGSLGHVSSPLNLSRLNRIVLLYGHLAGPCLCAAVYLWELELQAVCGTDFEPLLDRLADTRSILSSLFFWTLLICALLSFAEYSDSTSSHFHGEVTSTKRHDIMQTSIIANSGVGRQELYDLKNDPQGRFNLASQQPELVDELTRDLRSQIAKQSREPKLACPNP